MASEIIRYGHAVLRVVNNTEAGLVEAESGLQHTVPSIYRDGDTLKYVPTRVNHRKYNDDERDVGSDYTSLVS